MKGLAKIDVPAYGIIRGRIYNLENVIDNDDFVKVTDIPCMFLKEDFVILQEIVATKKVTFSDIIKTVFIKLGIVNQVD